ncbi:MAG: hypothetical protein ACYTDY_03085 [Planctomycetota bacterium]|jgi:hypothetical protein
MRAILIVLALVLVSGPAAADVVILKNGGRLTGRIVSESDREIVLILRDGMKMKVLRSMVETIERREEPEEPEPEPKPPAANPEPEPRSADPEPEPRPTGPGGEPRSTKPGPVPPAPQGEDGDPVPGSEDPPAASVAGPLFFDREPHEAWNRRFASYPEIKAAKTTRFRAYEHVSHEGLAVSTDHPKFAPLIRQHGHGGSLSRWKFRYLGSREFRYGDRVKFIAEITSPPSGQPLILLEEGPQPSAERMVVFLVRRDNTIKRYASPTVFGTQDFKTVEINKLVKERQPVRTYTLGFSPVATNWVVPEESEFLNDVTSPFGDSIRVRMSRYRYRLEWFDLPEDQRPKLDPDLLAKNVVKPIAAADGTAASPKQIRKYWGTKESNQLNFRDLRVEVKMAFVRLGIRPGSGFYIERDRVGVFGRKGLTLQTERYVLDAALLEELTRD